MNTPWFVWGLAWVGTAVLLGVIVAEVWIRLRDNDFRKPEPGSVNFTLTCDASKATAAFDRIRTAIEKSDPDPSWRRLPVPYAATSPQTRYDRRRLRWPARGGSPAGAQPTNPSASRSSTSTATCTSGTARTRPGCWCSPAASGSRSSKAPRTASSTSLLMFRLLRPPWRRRHRHSWEVNRTVRFCPSCGDVQPL